jgi:hypothetical protein
MHIFVILTKMNNIYFDINIFNLYFKCYYLLFQISYTFLKSSSFEDFHVFKNFCILFDSYQHIFLHFFLVFKLFVLDFMAKLYWKTYRYIWSLPLFVVEFDWASCKWILGQMFPYFQLFFVTKAYIFVLWKYSS